MNILHKIIANKKKEIEILKQSFPLRSLEKNVFFSRPVLSMKQALLNPEKAGIIAEFKRQSPSAGVIHDNPDVVKITKGYVHAGASGLSVLTDNDYFGGSREDIEAARRNNSVPILRKDFVVDEYQVIESKAIGADVILLIAAALDGPTVLKLSKEAKRLDMEILLEVKSKQELETCWNDHIDLVGVNNRNLEDFKVDVQTSLDMAQYLPAETVKISESGISNPLTIHRLKAAGYHGFLIGETFMKQTQPEKACAAFINEIMNLQYSEN